MMVVVFRTVANRHILGAEVGMFAHPVPKILTNEIPRGRYDDITWYAMLAVFSEILILKCIHD